MGYVHDVGMSKFISPMLFRATPVATWTPTIGSNISSSVRTAANAAFTVLFPVQLPSNSSYRKGAYLKSIDLYYKIVTEAMDVVGELVLDVVTLKTDGNAVAGTGVSLTMDTGHDSAAERLDIEDHTMTGTLDTPVWIDNDAVYQGSLVCDGGASGVFHVFGARLNYTLRI